MEKEFSLKAADGKKIHSVYNFDSKKKNDAVVVFVHGLTGHPNEHTFHDAAKQFPKKGVDVFRIALYWFEKGNRRLSECSLSTHTEDLNRVLKYLKPKYKFIHLVGHSCGSPTILKANHEIAASITLWDPSYLVDGIRHELKEVTISKKKYYLSEDHIEYLLSKELVNEWEWFNGKNELELIKNLHSPLHVIVAGNGMLKGAKKYVDVAEVSKRFTVIDKATHCFDEEGTDGVLLKETLAWIKKYSK